MKMTVKPTCYSYTGVMLQHVDFYDAIFWITLKFITISEQPQKPQIMSKSLSELRKPVNGLFELDSDPLFQTLSQYVDMIID